MYLINLVFASAMSLAAGFMAIVIESPPSASDVVIVIIPPWRDAAAVFTQAHVGQFGPRTSPVSYLVTGGPPATLATRLHDAGALAVIDPQIFDLLCKGTS